MIFVRLLCLLAFAAGISLLCYGFSQSNSKLMSFGIFMGIVGGLLFFGWPLLGL